MKVFISNDSQAAVPHTSSYIMQLQVNDIWLYLFLRLGFFVLKK